MKDFSFKNFNYALINSTKKGYKEVLVTYSANNSTARQCVFVKEASGKSSAYYTNKAKEIINKRIADGALAKSTSKQLRHIGSKGILKPALITLAGVVGVSAIGAGGYFTYKYFTNSGGGDVPPGPEPTTGYTVVLYAGEFDGSSGKATGQFSDGKTYLIFNNVAEGTHVDQIEGYTLPTCGDYDFSQWTTEIEGPHDVVSSDIILTATYREGIGYYKATAKQRMLAYAKEMKDLVPEDADDKETYDAAIDEICETTTNAIEASKQIVDDNTSVDVVNELTDFAISTMDTIYLAGPQSFSSVIDYYKNDVKDVAEANSPTQSLALTKVCTAYLGSLLDSTSVKNNNLDAAFDIVKEKLADSTLTETQLSLLTYAGSGCIGGAAYTAYSETELQKAIGTKLNTVLGYANQIEDNGGVSEASIKWFGEYIQNFYKVQSKCLSDTDYTNFLMNRNFAIDTYFQTLLRSPSDLNLASLNIYSSVIKGLADVPIMNLPRWAVFSHTVSWSLGNIINTIRGVGNELQYHPFVLTEVLSKSSDCYNKAMEAFALYSNGQYLSYLFGDSKSPPSILVQLNTLLTSIPSGLNEGNLSYKFLDVFEAALDSTVKIAENIRYGCPDGDSVTNYDTLLFNLTNSLYLILNDSDTLSSFYNQSEAVDCLVDIFSKVMELIPGSHNFQFYRDPKSPRNNRMQTIINLYNPNNTLESGDSLYLNSTVSRTTYAKVVTSAMEAGIKFFIGYEMEDEGESASMFINDMIDMLWKDWDDSIILNNMAIANPLATSLMGDLISKTISEYVFAVYENAMDFATPDLFPMYIKEVCTSVYSTVRRMILEFPSAPIQMFNSFAEIVDEFFTTLPLLRREDSAGMTYLVLNNLLGVSAATPTEASILYCYAFYPSKGDQVKVAIEENYINKITDHMTMGDLQTVVTATIEACKKIIYNR